MAGFSPRHAMSRMDPEQAKNLHLDRRVVRRAWAFAKPYRKLLVLNLVLLVGSALAGAAAPLIFKQLLDVAIPDRDFTLVNWLFAAAVALAIVTTALNIANRYIAANIGEGLIFDLRVKLYSHINAMSIGFFTRTQTGALLSRLNNDVIGAQSTVSTATTFASDLVTLTITLAAMSFLSWKVTLLALLVVPIFILLDRILGRRLAELSRQRMNTNAEMTSTATERFNVSGALLVKLFGRPADETASFSKKAGSVRAVGVRMAVTSRIYYGALALTAALGTAFVYWLGARSVINGGITIGTLTALAAYVARLYDPLTSIAGARVDLLTALVSFDRCFEVLDAPPGITDKPDAKPLEKPTGRVEFRKVWFRYPAPNTVSIASLEGPDRKGGDSASDWVLRDINLTVEPGQTVALVGLSGAGKTTLSSLVPRLYDVDQGELLLDGHSVADLTLQSVTDAIGVVSQDTHLFHDSVAANLRYAKPGASDDELVRACQGARIHDFIMGLEHGYDTLVGERGHRLSGGEKQRLAIARVLLKQPAIVILDEATAHLDSHTESLVQAALAEALHGRTALVIAHRLSTIRKADAIAVLVDGEIVEQGTHDQLFAADGRYRQLHNLQYS